MRITWLPLGPRRILIGLAYPHLRLISSSQKFVIHLQQPESLLICATPQHGLWFYAISGRADGKKCDTKIVRCSDLQTSSPTFLQGPSSACAGPPWVHAQNPSIKVVATCRAVECMRGAPRMHRRPPVKTLRHGCFMQNFSTMSGCDVPNWKNDGLFSCTFPKKSVFIV